MAQKAWARWIPDPLEFAVALSILVIFWAAWATPYSLSDGVQFWGGGLWSLLAFMSQMSLILLGGYVVASSSPVRRVIGRVVSWPKSHQSLYLLTFFISAVACWLNWGMGLVIGAFVALEAARTHKDANFPLLVAISYMGFLFWHGGLSGSIPLTVATSNNFSLADVGGLIAIDQTLFSKLNGAIIVSLLISLTFYIVFLTARTRREQGVDHSSVFAKENESVLVMRDGFSSLFYWPLVALIAYYLFLIISRGQFTFSLNQVNLVLIFLGLLLQKGLQPYTQAVVGGCGKLAPILIQYPIYAGIMGVIKSSGLAQLISQFFVSVSTTDTYSLFIFLSAGLINLMVPSGGGQWAVQAPVVMEGARQLGVSAQEVILAVAWGDAWTNMAQPFWALPLLSIVGLGLRDIIAYCLGALVISGMVIGTLFYLL